MIKLPCPPPLAITAEEAQGVEVGGWVCKGQPCIVGSLQVWLLLQQRLDMPKNPSVCTTHWQRRTTIGLVAAVCLPACLTV